MNSFPTPNSSTSPATPSRSISPRASSSWTCSFRLVPQSALGGVSCSVRGGFGRVVSGFCLEPGLFACGAGCFSYRPLRRLSATADGRQSKLSCSLSPLPRPVLGSFSSPLFQWNLQYVDYLGDIQSHPEDTELHRSILQLYGGIYDSFFQGEWSCRLGGGAWGICLVSMQRAWFKIISRSCWLDCFRKACCPHSPLYFPPSLPLLRIA